METRRSMSKTIDVFLGGPIEIESERAFLSRLVEDLTGRGVAALILANFHTPRDPHQVDFLVVTDAGGCHVELKHYTAPFSGGINGPWRRHLPDGSTHALEPLNPYQQALACKYALSDELHKLAACGAIRFSSQPRGKLYKHFESVVCIYPSLPSGTHVDAFGHVGLKGYPEFLDFILTRKPDPCLQREHWLALALRLALIKQEDLNEIIESNACTARKTVEEYEKRFQAFHASLPSLVPTRLRAGNGETIRSDAMLDRLARAQHSQLIGPSGSGKTHLAKHLALGALERGVTPLFVPAQYFEGRFSHLLDRSIAHVYPNTASHFLRNIQAAQRPLLLIVDGIDRVPASCIGSFIEGLQAFYLRWKTPILLTSQDQVSLPTELKGEVYSLQELDQEEKEKLLRAYLGESGEEHTRLFEPFRTAYEVRIAADCIVDLNDRVTKPKLLDVYIQRNCEKTSDPPVVRLMLRSLARFMAEQLVSTISVAEAWRIAESALQTGGEKVSLVNEWADTGLILLEHGSWRFTHELIERFLQAEALSQEVRSATFLKEEIVRPRNQHVSAFIVSLQKDEQRIKACLEVADADLLAEALRGSLGTLTMQVALAEVESLLGRSLSQLQQAELSVKRGEHWLGELVVNNTAAWTAYDRTLMNAMGIVVTEGILVASVFELVRRTDEKVIEYLRCHEIDKEIRSDVFALQYALLNPETHELPASVIVHRAHGTCKRIAVASLDKIASLLKTADERTPGELYLLCSLYPCEGAQTLDALPDFLRVCLQTGIAHLQMEALRLAEGCSQALSRREPVRERVKGVLQRFDSHNIGISSSLVDAMLAYEMVESPVSMEQALNQMQSLLKNPEDPESQQWAHTCITRIFEDVFQAAYYHAFHELTELQQVDLLTMAALAAEYIGMFEDWTLAQLIKHNNRRSLPAFLRWATEIQPDTPFQQDTAATYFYPTFRTSRIAFSRFITPSRQLLYDTC